MITQNLDNYVPLAFPNVVCPSVIGLPGTPDWYSWLWFKSQLTTNPAKIADLNHTCDQIQANRSRYLALEIQTGVPWKMIAIIHSLECDLNFYLYLGNGNPISHPTKDVPAGRGPFATFELGAQDALKYDGLSGRANWDIPTCLMYLEKFNGLGYLKFHPNVPSPYIWSYTSVYTEGKYGSDDHWDPTLVSEEAGAAAILKTLLARGD